MVDHLCAVQAQDFAGAKWALGLRMNSATDASVEKAFNDGLILRTHVLRPTWHFVSPADIRWLLTLTAPRVHTLNGTSYRKLELDDRLLTKSVKVLERALGGGKYLTRDELRPILEKAGIQTTGDQRMSYLMMHAELEGVICSGPRSGNQFTYALLSERAPVGRDLDLDEAGAELAFRFFASRGPATLDDFAKWSGLTKLVARRGLADVRDRLNAEVIEDREYFFGDARPTAGNVATAHLLSIYDEYVSGYKDRGATVEREFGEKLIAMGNALTGIIVVDGLIAGTWKRKLSNRSVTVVAQPFIRLEGAQRRALDESIERYASFLELPLA
ncbi:MAG: winged helix DNA-binding domain-containing protein [Gemmatimonadaceae bacterium]